MAKSRRLRDLEKRLDVLHVHFLPTQFSPMGQYTARQHDLARAYVLLVHAEMESYMEDRAREVAHKVQTAWQRANRHSKIIRRLFNFHNRRDRPWKPFERASKP